MRWQKFLFFSVWDQNYPQVLSGVAIEILPDVERLCSTIPTFTTYKNNDMLSSWINTSPSHKHTRASVWWLLPRWTAQISDRNPRQGCKQTDGKDDVSLTTGECQHFNTPGGCTWTLNESLREGGGGMVENHGPLRQKWNMAGSDGMHRITMRNEEWGDRSLQPKHCRGSFWSTGTELLWLLQQSGLGSHHLTTGDVSSIQQELLCLYRETGKKDTTWSCLRLNKHKSQ